MRNDTFFSRNAGRICDLSTNHSRITSNNNRSLKKLNVSKVIEDEEIMTEVVMTSSGIVWELYEDLLSDGQWSEMATLQR